MASSPVTLDGSGLTLGQKLALAATMFCKPCCQGSGSGGGGSGSGSEPDTHCCGCDEAWPSTLTVTVTIDCIGTRTITLNRITVNFCGTVAPGDVRGVYTGSYSSGAGGLFFKQQCDGIILSDSMNQDELLSVGLTCYQCEADTTIWRVDVGWLIYTTPLDVKDTFIAQQLEVESCSPRSFVQKTGTLGCLSANTTQCIDCSPSVFSSTLLCYEESLFANCVGSGYTIDISE